MLPTNFIKLMLIMCSLLLSACSMAQDQPPPKQHVTLKLGKQGEESFRQAHAHVDDVTAPSDVVGFMELRWWTADQLGTVTIDHGGHKINFPHTIFALGSSWPDYPDEGVTGLALRTGITAPEYVRHEEAWKTWQALLKHVQENGWQSMIFNYNARVRGEAAYNYIMANKYSSGVVFDASYDLNYVQWQNLLNKESSISTYFYQDGAYLILTLNQEIVMEDELAAKKLNLNLDEWGQYIVYVEFDTVRDSTRNAMLSALPKNEGGTTTELKIEQNLPFYWQELKQLRANRREKAEQEVIQQGYKIDTSYQDPDITPYLQSKPAF